MNKNQNQISTLTTRMNGNQVYLHLLVSIATPIRSPYGQITNVKLSMECQSSVLLFSSHVIDANENFRFIQKKLKGDNSNPL